MHYDGDMEDSASMQRWSVIESLQFMLIGDCPASAGQSSYVMKLLPCFELWTYIMLTCM